MRSAETRSVKPLEALRRRRPGLRTIEQTNAVFAMILTELVEGLFASISATLRRICDAFQEFPFRLSLHAVILIARYI